jgi:hypothetical protein
MKKLILVAALLLTGCDSDTVTVDCGVPADQYFLTFHGRLRACLLQADYPSAQYDRFSELARKADGFDGMFLNNRGNGE